jgi:hypothetical protein
MKLSDLAKASAKRPNHSILLYGPPKTGKTKLVGTAAAVPEINRIFWIDGENGAETLLHMGLTPEQLDKITLYRIPDTRETPRFIETVLKMFSSKEPILVCDLHGRVSCVECQDKITKKFTGESFCLKDCTHNDLVVIDSGSQLGDSALNMACAGKPLEYKPGWDEYGLQSKWLGDILSVMQAAFFTNFVMISHVIPIEEEHNGVKKDKLYPLVGTKAFCSKVGKYFGTVVYTEIKMGKHAAGSGSTYKTDCITGSRVNALLEKSANLDMKAILIEGGILK